MTEVSAAILSVRRGQTLVEGLHSGGAGDLERGIKLECERAGLDVEQDDRACLRPLPEEAGPRVEHTSEELEFSPRARGARQLLGHAEAEPLDRQAFRRALIRRRRPLLGGDTPGIGGKGQAQPPAPRRA